MKENNYNWEYLDKEIIKHYGTYECFVDSINDEMGLSITCNTFIKQKTRQSNRPLKDYSDFIIKEHGTSFDKLKIVLSDIVDSTFALVTVKKSITIKNTGSIFLIQKSWERYQTETINIGNELFKFLDELMKSEFLKEVLEDDELISLIKEKIKIYIEKKILLFDFIKFTFNKQTINVEIKFNQITTSFTIEKDAFGELAASFPGD